MPTIAGLEPAAGAAVIEPDGRVWTVVPTNGYGAKAALPKGRLGRSGPQETAIREVWEETGLHVELLAWLVDVQRTTTITRYYLARRIGGSPVACGWESQAVRLVPLDRLGEVLTTAADAVLVGALAGKNPGHWPFLLSASLAMTAEAR